MLDGLAEIAERIRDAEQRQAGLAQRLRFNSGKAEYPETLEKELYYPVEGSRINCTVAAVDAGIAGEELHGFDFLLQRTLGVVFEYRNSRVAAHKYYPSAMPAMQYDMRSGLDSHDVMWHKSLFRLKGELTCAEGLIGKHAPSCLMLDGSIAPLLSDKPPEESEVRPLYDETVAAYRKLYEAAWEKNCALLGVIKDSRSRRFLEILGRHAKEAGLLHTTDTNFLFHLLQERERTCAFSYSSSPARHQILKDLGQWAEKILSFYVKPVKGDRPLRVEFLSGQKTFSEIAALVQAQSCLHKAYAYPPALIDADLRAALAPDEFERAYGSLFSRVGGAGSLLRLRRNSRPFR